MVKVIEYDVLVPEDGRVFNVLEMLRHSQAVVAKVEAEGEDTIRISLWAEKTRGRDGVGWNLEQSIPRWKQFGYAVENVKVQDYVGR